MTAQTPAGKERAKITITKLAAMKKAGEKIAVLTVYDASFTQVLEEAGVEVLLVGDSLGMVIQGHETTVPVTMDHMVYHTRNVARACRRALLMADLPFMSYCTPQQACANAARLMQEGGAHMVKLEGGAAQVETVRQLAMHGVSVCAHLGLQPQSVHKLGGYRLQGRSQAAADALLRDAESLQEAGADVLLLECVPAALAAEIAQRLAIPVIGIGAGPHCDAQVLVLYDLLGLSRKPPRFSRNFLAGTAGVHEAVEAYVRAVKSGDFPGPEHVLA